MPRPRLSLLLTAVLLIGVTPAVEATAGADVEPGCCDPGADPDCDCVWESLDNFPGIYNPSQSDADGDGRGTECDNCSSIANGPLAYAAGLAARSQCDKDSDGYGNACDGDLDGNGFVTPLDNPIYLANLMAFLPGPSGWACKGLPGLCPPLP